MYPGYLPIIWYRSVSTGTYGCCSTTVGTGTISLCDNYMVQDGTGTQVTIEPKNYFVEFKFKELHNVRYRYLPMCRILCEQRSH
jgi:hypothetical protein